MSGFATVHAGHVAALNRYNNLPDDLEDTDRAAFEREEQIYSDASTALDNATPTNWREMIVLLEHTIGGGMHPGRETCDELIGHARRLLVERVEC